MRNLQESNYKARHNHNHIGAWLPDHGGECVPALVCPNCGEAYLDEDVTAKLLKDAQERANAGAQVEIRQYVAA